MFGLFPFIRNLKAKRIITTAPNGWYVRIPYKESDDNARNVFETTVGPPNMDIAGGRFTVPQSPGPEPSFFLPQVEWVAQPSVGLLQTSNTDEDANLYTSPASVPQQEIF
jgi:hypothetical protein